MVLDVFTLTGASTDAVHAESYLGRPLPLAYWIAFTIPIWEFSFPHRSERTPAKDSSLF